jgi:hypothetical protein
LSLVLVIRTGFGLEIGFINLVHLVTTNNYKPVTDFLLYKALHAKLLSLFPLVFTIRISTQTLNYTLPISLNTKSLLIIINTAPPLFLHFMVHYYTQTHTHTH